MIHFIDSIITDSNFDFLKMTCMMLLANSNTLRTINSKINKIDNRVRIALSHLNASYEYLHQSCQINNQFDKQMPQFIIPKSKNEKDNDVAESNDLLVCIEKKHKKAKKSKKACKDKGLSISDITYDMVKDQVESQCGQFNLDQQTVTEEVRRMFGEKKTVSKDQFQEHVV